MISLLKIVDELKPVRVISRIIWSVLGVAFFVVIVAFSLLNAHAVHIDMLLTQMQLPLAIVVGVTFIVGMIIGFILGWSQRLWRKRRFY